MKKEKYTPALGYDFLTAYYDLTIKLTMPEKKFRKLLIESVDPNPNESILEFGFGTGQNLILVNHRSPNSKIQGVDIDPKVKSLAEHKLAKRDIDIPLCLYDGITLTFDGNSFDKIFSCLVFHQLKTETKIQCLNELYRILKPGGKLIIADWGKAQNRLMRLSFVTVQMLDGFKTTHDNVKGLLPGIIEKAGFKEIERPKSINTAIGTFTYFNYTK